MAKILLAEDDTSMREYLQRALQRVGYEVEAVGCGTEAMPLLETERFDLLLTDIVMPGGMNGLELVERFRATHPDTPVLMTTGYNEDLVADIPRGSKLDVIGKPYRRDELADRIRMAIDRRSSAERRQEQRFGPKEG